MTLDGAKIYTDEIEFTRECEEKLRQIITAVKILSATEEIGFRCARQGRVFEAMLWANSQENPVGIFRRGHSLKHVLEMIHGKINEDSHRALIKKGAVPFKNKSSNPQFARLSA
ncbi:MAG: hypothetical protein ACXVA9_07120 [Bdellovibrionales bacterium]